MIEKHGNNTGLYCSGCGKWHKWLNKDEVRVYSQKYKKEEKEKCVFNTITNDHFFTIPIECTIVEKINENGKISKRTRTISQYKYKYNGLVAVPEESNVTLTAHLYDYDKEIFIDDAGNCEFGRIVWSKKCSDGSMKDVHTGKSFTFISQNDQYYTASLIIDPDSIEKIENSRQSYDTLINKLKEFTDYLDKVIDREMMKEPLSEGDSIRKCAYCTALERDKNALLNIINGKDWISTE
ncbi:hypothetical protein [Blautia caecimuris]|uniref:hypothetical protein n=1 Tax=Blautia caecimuris TaxID=1796615 RepID=UPI0036F2830B